MVNINTSDPYKTHTLNEFISVGKSSSTVTYYASSILDQVKGINYSIDNIVFDYMDELKQLRVKVKLDQAQARYYMYDGVYMLSYDLYKTRDLAYLIMALNGVYNPKDFTMDTIYIIRPNNMQEILSAIYNAEKEYIDINRSSLGLNR